MFSWRMSSMMILTLVQATPSDFASARRTILFSSRPDTSPSPPNAVCFTAGLCDCGNQQCSNFSKLNPDFVYGQILSGSEVMSGLPALGHVPPELVKIDRTAPEFDATLRAVSVDPGLGSGTFGDKGYANPGRGGIGNFDIFEVGSTITLSTVGTFFDSSGFWEVGNGGAKYQPWWSRPEDSNGLTIAQSQDQVSQTCFGVKQILQCEFTAGTRMMVGIGNWRATNSAPAMTPGGGLGVCDATEAGGVAYSNPQKVVTPSVFQYLVPLGLAKADQFPKLCVDAAGRPLPDSNCATAEAAVEAARDSPVHAKNCFVCPVNESNVSASFDDLSRRLVSNECRISPFYPNDRNLLGGSLGDPVDGGELRTTTIPRGPQETARYTNGFFHPPTAIGV